MSKGFEAKFCSVYGPVNSWRYGLSLGIDPIGLVSTCSFNCVYCQLGEIEVSTAQRQEFIPTAQIIADLQSADAWGPVDVVTLSGSGEPTLALNLADILTAAKHIFWQPTVVLTNSTLLTDPAVRRALSLADYVAAKLDAVSPEQLQRVNRPIPGIDLPTILSGIRQLRQEYRGHLAIQTMLLSPWSTAAEADYIRILQDLAPEEVQLNTPTRPRVLARQLESRGNDEIATQPYALRNLKSVSGDVLQAFADRIHRATGIPVRCAPGASKPQHHEVISSVTP